MQSLDRWYDIAVIGGGASGIMAAISAKINGARSVAIIEKNERIGKKLLITGNGRCNLSNINADKAGYNGDADFAKSIISQFNVQNTVDFFEKYGLITYADSEDRIYPNSNQASSVLDVLRLLCEQLKIQIVCDRVNDIIPSSRGYRIEGEQSSVMANKVILACAGKAAPNTGSNGDMFKVLEKLNFKIIKMQPSLCPLKTDVNAVKSLKGVRAKCKATLYKNSSAVCSDTGEVQFNDDNLSGIVIMQLSSKMTVNNASWQVGLDFMGDYDKDKLFALLLRRISEMGDLTCERLLDGVINKKLAFAIIKRAGIEKLSLPISKLTKAQLKSICGQLYDMRFEIKSKAGFDKAQVTAGGLDTKQFDDKLQSKLHKGFYACGEVLNVDGICGGYNLQWAWSSGYIAGKNAAYSLKSR